MACIPVYKGKRFPSTKKLLAYLSTEKGIMDHLADGEDTEFLKAIEEAVGIADRTLYNPQQEVAAAPAEEEVVVEENKAPIEEVTVKAEEPQSSGMRKKRTKGEIKPTNQPQINTERNPDLKHDPSLKERGDFVVGDDVKYRDSDKNNQAEGEIVGFSKDRYYNVFVKLSSPFKDEWGIKHKVGDIVLVQGAFLDNKRIESEQKELAEKKKDDVTSPEFRRAFENQFGGISEQARVLFNNIQPEASGERLLEIAKGLKEKNKNMAMGMAINFERKLREDPNFNDERKFLKTNREDTIAQLKWMAENGVPIPSDLAKEVGIKQSTASTQPNQQTNDSQNQVGVSGKSRIGQTPQQAEPLTGSSEVTSETGGGIQGNEEVEVAPTQSPFAAFDTPKEAGRKARAELKSKVGPEQFKKYETIHRNGEKILKGLEARNLIRIECP